MTEKIQEFLAKFDDQHLANLQCAAEDGTLVYYDCNRCLLHYFRGDYSVTKWQGEYAALAREAEAEYRELVPITDLEASCSMEVEDARRKAMLPLVQAEWARRGYVKIQQQFNKIEEFAQVSPSVR